VAVNPIYGLFRRTFVTLLVTPVSADADKAGISIITAAEKAAIFLLQFIFTLLCLL
jgi:hypothetical protein